MWRGRKAACALVMLEWCPPNVHWLHQDLSCVHSRCVVTSSVDESENGLFFFLSFFTLGSSGRNSLPRLPGAPSLRPQALLTTWTDICWCLFPLLRQTFSYQKMMWRADTPGATLFFGAAAPRVHNNGYWIFHAALGSAGTTNAQAVLKQRFSRFVFAAKLYYVVQRWQKYSHCVLQFKCGYLCEKNTPIKVRKDRFRYRYVLN